MRCACFESRYVAGTSLSPHTSTHPITGTESFGEGICRTLAVVEA